MARVYATVADLAASTGAPAPDDAVVLLRDASVFLDAELFRLCIYDVDSVTGLPTDSRVVELFRDAVCAQVKWWDELGDSTGAAGAGWDEVGIGSVKLQRRSPTAVGPSDSAARQVGPQVGDVILAAQLPQSVFRRGVGTDAGWCW